MWIQKEQQGYWKMWMKRKDRIREAKGFSIMELLVTLAVLGIMIGIAIPAFSVWLADSGLKRAATDLFSTMQWARTRAIKGNTQWAVVFDVTAGAQKYLVCSSAGGDSDWSTTGDNTVERTVRFSDYGNDIGFGHGIASDDIPGNGSPPADDVSYTNDLVVFNASGFSGSGYVYLQNSKGNTYGVGTRSTGIILLRKWNKNASRWE